MTPSEFELSAPARKPGLRPLLDKLLAALRPHRPAAETWTARNGVPVTLRPARASDRAQMQSFVRGLSKQSRYQRFFIPLHELPPDLLARYTGAGPAHELTLLAVVTGSTGELVVSMAQYVSDNDSGRGEFAVAVADAWQGEGLGSRMIDTLGCIARHAGMARLEADVLATNGGMRRLLERMGFTIRQHPEEDNLVRATRRLGVASCKASPLAVLGERVRGVRVAGHRGVATAR